MKKICSLSLICSALFLIVSCQSANTIPLLNPNGPLKEFIMLQYKCQQIDPKNSYLANYPTPLLFNYKDDGISLKFSSIDQNNSSETLSNNQLYQTNKIDSKRIISQSHIPDKLINMDQLCQSLNSLSFKDMKQIRPNQVLNSVNVYGIAPANQEITPQAGLEWYIFENSKLTQLKSGSILKSDSIELLISYQNTYAYVIVPIL